MFRRGGILEGSEDKKSVTRIDPQKCGRCVQPGSLRPKLASATAYMLDCFSRFCSRRAIAEKNRNLVRHGLFRERGIGGKYHKSLGDGIWLSRKWDVNWAARGKC